MTIDILELVDEVQAEIPEVLEFTALRAVRQAAMEFMERSGVWRWHTDVPMTGADNYVIQLPIDAAIDAPFKVVYSQASSLRELMPVQPHQLSQGLVGTPHEYAIEESTITVFPNPDAGSLRVWLRLKPTRKANTIPAGIGDRWFYGIRAGAMAKILTLVGQPWYKPDAALPYIGKFDNDILEASREARRSKSHQRRVVSYGGV